MSKLKEILNTFSLSLPKLTAESNYFPDFLFAHLDTYFEEVKKSEDLLESIYTDEQHIPIVENRDTFISQLEKIISGIKKCSESYLNGLPGRAYEYFKNTIQNTYLKPALQTSQLKYLRRDYNFYRIRKGNIDEPINPEELFHIPFEKRKLVSTQRFSIPGFPCLYAGNSLSVSYKETDVFTDDKLSMTKIARLSNFSNILIVDIEPYQMSIPSSLGVFGKSAKTGKDIYQSGLLYPLIAACHCKINYAGSPNFKIEYIIPQLLLQWFKEARENKLIQGIRYLSNRIDVGDDSTKMYNYVFPVVDCQKQSGHCNYLKNLFGITNVIDVSKFSFVETLFSKKITELENHLNGLPLNNLNGILR